MPGIRKEIWAAGIAEKIFPAGSWMLKSVDDSAFVDGKIVHTAQAGALPTVTRNRVYTGAAVAAALRTDTDNPYTIDEYTTDPITIPNIDETEVNYAKRASVLYNHTSVLDLATQNWMQTHWAPSLATNIVRTTGTALPAQIPGATGNRKRLTVEDWLKLKSMFDDMDIDENDRQALVPSYMLNDFIGDNKTLLLNLNTNGDAIYESGSLRKMFGFNIQTRGKINALSYDNAALPAVRLPTAAGVIPPTLATANAAILAWHPRFVRRAKGATKVFEKNQDPQYYGDVISALTRAGGKKMRTDQLGVAAIVEVP